jgi:hypothetical protein
MSGAPGSIRLDVLPYTRIMEYLMPSSDESAKISSRRILFPYNLPRSVKAYLLGSTLYLIWLEVVCVRAVLFVPASSLHLYHPARSYSLMLLVLLPWVLSVRALRVASSLAAQHKLEGIVGMMETIAWMPLFAYLLLQLGGAGAGIPR